MMLQPTDEAMLMYIRSIPADEQQPEQRPRKKSFLSRLSFRKRSKDGDDEDSRLSFTDSERSRSGSFFERLSFLQPKSTKAERPSLFSHRNLFNFEKENSNETDVETETEDQLSELPSPSDIHSIHSTSPAHRPSGNSTMILRRHDVPYHLQRRHSTIVLDIAPQKPISVVEPVNDTELALMGIEDVNVVVKFVLKSRMNMPKKNPIVLVNDRISWKSSMEELETSAWFDESLEISSMHLRQY